MSTPEAAQPAGSPYLTVIGESLVDIIDDPHRASAASQTHPGGSPLNVAIGAARLNLPTTLVTHYGEDPLAAQTHQIMDRN